MADPRVNEFLSRMVASIEPEKAAGLDGSIQVNLAGDQAGAWFITIKDRQCSLHEGTAPVPRLTITVAANDFMNIFSGKLDGMQAFMQGKLKVAGDMGLALKLIGLFKMK